MNHFFLMLGVAANSNQIIKNQDNFFENLATLIKELPNMVIIAFFVCSLFSVIGFIFYSFHVLIKVVINKITSLREGKKKQNNYYKKRIKKYLKDNKDTFDKRDAYFKELEKLDIKHYDDGSIGMEIEDINIKDIIKDEEK